MRIIFLSIFVLLFSVQLSYSQLLLNEIQTVNTGVILDEDGSPEDWIELYNAGSQSVNLLNYGLTDNPNNPFKWKFPNFILSPQSRVLVFASGKNRLLSLNHWETAVYGNDIWTYFVGISEPPTTWKDISFSAGWQTGNGGFGYGDGDDQTIITNTTSLYLRKNFNIPDTSKIVSAVLSIDYDDSFVAYLNGTEILRSNVVGNLPPFDALAAAEHEALVYQGGNPESYNVDIGLLKSLIVNGSNVLAIQIHNASAGSSDMSALPYLSFGLSDNSIIWGPTPSWFPANISNLHAGFTLNPSGETVVLTDPSGTTLDSYSPNLSAGLSVSRTTDAATTWCITNLPSPNASNVVPVCYSGFAEDVVFGQAPGFYPGNISVTLGPTIPGTVIRYTLNGQIPTQTDNLYSIPVSIIQTRALKARRFSTDPAKLPGKTATNTYFINDNVSIPVISLTTNDTNLYGANGIYDNYWTDWKKPVYVEYFDSLHHNAFEQNAGIKIDGGAGGSRSNPQRSFRVEPQNDQYGDGDVHYGLIPDRPWLNQFATFYLRNGSNYWNRLPYKDAWLTRSMKKSNTGYSAYTPVVVYLNGDYWGVYELREKQDKDYFQNNYGADTRELDLLSVSYFYGGSLRVVEGSDTGWYNMESKFNALDTQAPDFLSKADAMLDVKDYTDYIIAETWFGNYDWPSNNIKIWRSRTTDNKWHYSLIDLELAIGGWSGPADDFINWVYPGPNGTHTQFYSILMQNPEYKKFFINRNADLMNTILLPQKLAEVGEPMRQQILTEMPRQFARWTDTLSQSVQTSMDNFIGEHDYLNYLFSQRTQNVWQHTKTAFSLIDTLTITLKSNPPQGGFIKISTIIPESLPWKGVYYNGNPVRITAIPNPGYTFQNWSSVGTNVTGTQISQEISFATATQVTANFIGSPETADIVVSEINYNQDSSLASGDWFEIFNNGISSVDISDWKIYDSQPLLAYTIPTGTTIQAGERLVFSTEPQKFDLVHPSVNRIGGSLFHFSNGSETIEMNDKFESNVVKITYADSLPWPACPDGYGRTLEIDNPNLDPNLAASWFCGCVGGSPGLPFSPCVLETVKVSEINYRSPVSPNAGDWIEIVNTENTSKDISGWIFKDDKDYNLFVIPSGTIIPANARLVLFSDLNLFQSVYTGVSNFSGPFTFGLSGGGSALRLYNGNGKLHYSVVYDDAAPWPTQADGLGYTLEADTTFSPSLDVCKPTSWFAGCYLGSPGKAFVRCDLGYENSLQNSQILFWPNPAEEFLNFKANDLDDQLANIKVTDISGKVIFSEIRTLNSEVNSLDVSNLSPGLYICEIKSQNQVLKVFKWIKK